jgi:2-hydroxy-3-keto-5-methylthiopentenyl-1-phosphate phosphatase
LVAIKESMIIGWWLKPFSNHHKIGNWKFSIVSDWIFQGGMQYVFGKLLTNAITRWPNNLKISITYDQKGFQSPNYWWSKNFNHLTYGNQKSTSVAIWKGLIIGWRPKPFAPILGQSKKIFHHHFKTYGR